MSGGDEIVRKAREERGWRDLSVSQPADRAEEVVGWTQEQRSSKHAIHHDHIHRHEMVDLEGGHGRAGTRARMKQLDTVC